MIERRALRDDVAAEILARVVDGRLAAGDHVSESRLAAELGVSRTPLREALLVLLGRGLVTAEPGRGFRVPPLGRREIEEILEALAVCEPAAVRLAGPVSPRTVMELQNHLARGRLATRPADIAILTHHLCELLLGACPNRVLREQVEQLGARSLRYLRVAREQGWDPTGWLEAWAAAVEALRTGQADQAAERLGAARRAMRAELPGRIPAAELPPV